MNEKTLHGILVRPTDEKCIEWSAEGGVPLEGLPFAARLGLRLLHAADGMSAMALPYNAELAGLDDTGILHGGAITALLDTCCGGAVMSFGGRFVSTATLDLRIDYMRPAPPGQPVFARALCHRVTRHIAFVSAEAFCREGATGEECMVSKVAASFIVEGRA